ncbi:MAG TPA: hypothetical protein VG871_10750 [Vicinamibacterales bacterium]|nr:hypothetical protein [Vicinamibacterales bacterium]
MKPGPRRGFRWDRQTIVYAIDLWHRTHLSTPTRREWCTASEDHPSFDTVARVFGSWNAAIRAAGFRARRPGQRRAHSERRRSAITGRFIAADEPAV